MHIQSLAGKWEFSQLGGAEWLPGSVPGGVHTDLLAAGRIPDPFMGDNEKRVQWVAEADWVYRRKFTCTSELLQEDMIFLVCDGLDTLATIELNGHMLDQTDNMFRRYEWEVKALLKNGGENTLTIAFASPVRYITAKNAVRELVSPYHSIPGGPYIRKAPCQFGWDWGPKLPPTGIWKDIRLEGSSQAWLEEIHLRQSHAGGQVIVEAQVSIQQWGQASLELKIDITAPDGKAFTGGAEVTGNNIVSLRLPINNPVLWWPNGYGDQPLYQVTVSLSQGGPPAEELIDQRTYQIGLRTIEMRQQEDEWGRSFAFIVNGVKIFAKGSNWIPADSFPTRITRDSLESLILAAAESHQNMLRVWGGGFYENELFYDLCDRYGILVWQEFIFACSIYPLHDPEFLENIHQEVIQNVRRLRHRASLALWCGNNEMEEGWLDWNWDTPENTDLKNAYDRFFHHDLKKWCQEEDPDHAYWPSSPSSNTPFIDANGQRQGDTHYWDVWHKGQPFTAYRQQYPRFMSEFGFQALPPLETVRTYASEEDWNMTSYIMEQHQKNASGNAMMIRQMLDTFKLPKDFESLVYLSMALQAEGIRYGVEHWRRHPERVAGILYWQLNDCWPVASWSSLDYFGRWKALHYAARRFFAPVMLSIEDKTPEMSVYVSNDLLTEWVGTVKWSLETLEGTPLGVGSSRAQVSPQSATQTCKLDFSDKLNQDNLRNVVFIAELSQADHVKSRQVATFVPVKHLELQKPAIHVQLKLVDGQLLIALESDTLALAVELSFEGADVVFSDNYFPLPARRLVELYCTSPQDWSIEKARQALRIRSVYDSYSHEEKHV